MINKPTISRYYGVQALRGIAALAVVIFHIAKMEREKLHVPGIDFTVGAGGVDIFFAISGFVMIITTAHAWGNSGLWITFLRRRLLRIAPLYWLMTAFMALSLFAMPGLAQHSVLRPWHSVASFLFIPAWNASHEAFPLIVVGWSLSFEMLFYLIFTLTLALHLHPARWVSIILCSLALVSGLRTNDWGAPATLMDPLLLEFVGSMWIGMATLKDHKIPESIALWLLPLTVACLLATNLMPSAICFQYRVIVWGIPGALLLACVVALEERLRPYVTGFPSLVGDASYAIYLSHGFVLTFVSIVLSHLRLGYGLTMAGGYIGTILLSMAVGIAIYRKVEQPLIGSMRNASWPSLRWPSTSKVVT